MRNRGITETAIPIRNLIIVVLIIAGAGIIASLYPARRAGRLDVLTAIATA
jgi:putative ABC transport system permease protein